MTDFLNKILGDLEAKKEWKATEARAKALPEEYRTVYEEVKHYIWQGGAGVMDPSNMPSNIFKQMVDRFEEGAANGKHVLDVTGDDVAAFVKDLMHGEKTFEEELREKLNREIAKKLGK